MSQRREPAVYFVCLSIVFTFCFQPGVLAEILNLIVSIPVPAILTLAGKMFSRHIEPLDFISLKLS